MDLEVKISRRTARSAYRLLKRLDLYGRGDILNKQQRAQLDKTLYELKRLLRESEQQ